MDDVDTFPANVTRTPRRRNIRSLCRRKETEVFVDTGANKLRIEQAGLKRESFQIQPLHGNEPLNGSSDRSVTTDRW